MNIKIALQYIWFLILELRNKLKKGGKEYERKRRQNNDTR